MVGKSDNTARFRALVKGIDSDSIERRLHEYAPQLDLITDEIGAPPDAVILSWSNYLALAERAETAAAFAASRDEESFPDEVAARLVAGDNPVKVFREHRDLSLRQLAAASGLSLGYLSDIENGKRKGPTDTMKALATALAVDLDMLV
ncbi:MAG: XRE family transcriptional regulator [Magnetospirillum sp.]|nr:MAG: XRE family transcriptional regulator [Magnetospirillum sp.]